MWTIIVTVLIGAVIGALARLVLPGRQSISTLVTVILGVLGALIGSSVVNGTSTEFSFLAVVVGVIAAAVLIVVYGMVVGRKQT
ncbi:GlsB/YeaQ/YmgE family stress response membrane protein [Janibacter sp. GS2]|uniref:GlsB/YeaQ/YmgE family stress response membrane protein n=1 Tax=Janibacter sp. GS2 TaxID=3442646 RepID=UPI003EB7D43D